MNRQEAGKIVAVIVAACPAQSSKLDSGRVAAMVETFAALLDDLSYEQVNASVRVLLQTRTWMPSVADIRATALELTRGPVAAGGEAWGSVLKCIGRYGAYRRPGVDFVFNDPVTARCVQSLGWSELCLSENAVADRARFIDLYDRLATQERREIQSPLLGAAAEQREALGAGEAVARVLKLAEGKP